MNIKTIDELKVCLFASLPFPQEIKLYTPKELGELKLDAFPDNCDLSYKYYKYFHNGWHFNLSEFEHYDETRHIIFGYFNTVFLLQLFTHPIGISMENLVDSEDFRCFEIIKFSPEPSDWGGAVKTVSSTLITRLLNITISKNA